MSPVSSARPKGDLGITERRGRSLRLRAAERRVSRSGARRLLRGSHPRLGRRTFPRGKRGARRTRDRTPCEGNERGNPFALAAARSTLTGQACTLGNQAPASGKRSARPFVRAGEGRMLERACPCVASGCRSRRAAPDRQGTPRPRSEARGRRPSHSPTSDLPGTERARGKRRRIGARESGAAAQGNERPTRGWRRGCWFGAGDASPEPDTSQDALTLAGEAACASRGRQASGSRSGRRRWKALRVVKADSRSRAGRGKRPRFSRGSAPHRRKRFAKGEQGTREDDSGASEARSKGNGRKTTPIGELEGPPKRVDRRETIGPSILVASGLARGSQRGGPRRSTELRRAWEALPSGSSEARVHGR